ncbi:MAG TPA: alpha/beta hydrolase, partial [Candidatus Obscuribacter sp.]|nr:alpha/beta hydrolase [Candidatus Obscuribacter sp.]
DLEKSLEDLDDSIIQIRKDFSGVPVFVLGESMGGSLALQFCAKHPELVEGLIAAVPSEQRYRQWLTAGKVILGMLTGSRKQIDVGPVLVNRATQDEGLRQTWTSDPQSRFTATAKELYGFKRFVSRNRDLAKQVKTTPVLMFQGVHDLLIRPEGTISLFKAVASEDKDLMLVGKSEHLVFEEGQFDKALLVSICDWMKTRGSK